LIFIDKFLLRNLEYSYLTKHIILYWPTISCLSQIVGLQDILWIPFLWDLAISCSIIKFCNFQIMQGHFDTWNWRQLISWKIWDPTTERWSVIPQKSKIHSSTASNILKFAFWMLLFYTLWVLEIQLPN